MDFALIAIGIAIGLAVAAPLGPVNLLVIRAALNRGMTGGLIAGSGAVLADSSFAAIAAFGIRAVEHAIAAYAVPLQLLGGLLLVVIGIRTARAHVASLNSATPEVSPGRTALAALTLTLVNPGSLMGFLAIFGAMGAALQLGLAPHRPALAVAGVAIGGTLWWLFVAATAHHLKSRLTPATLDRINRWAGVLITAFGFVLLLELAA